MNTSPRNPGNAGVHWARVANRLLRLSDDAEIVRQEHRGMLWYVVRDRLGDRYYRFGSGVYMLLVLLDGKRTVEEAYQIVCDRLGDDAPTEIEVIKLLRQLHAAGLLRGDTVGRTDEVVSQAQDMDRQRWLMQLRSPLAIRIPLVDPAPVLRRLDWLARALFSIPGFLIWLTVVLAGLSEVALSWADLTTNFSDRILAFDNLALIWLVFPVVKILHEFGHGLALRRWGCQSHEMGIMFLVFMPVPYIDASAAAVMTHPAQRAAVGAAGLYVELFIAAIAALLWAHLEEGLVHAVCFNVIIIGGASAVLFNGNPLLKFDAYYVLSDVLEIPNLAQRSAQWWLAYIQKHLLRFQEVADPVEAPGEEKWLILYIPSSFTYRSFLIFAIVVFVSKKLFYLGTILAATAVFNIVVWPLWRGIRFIATTPRLNKGRSGAIARTAAAAASIAFIIFAVPVPYRTLAEGVAWYSEGAELVPAASGFVVAFASSSGDLVAPGELILQMSDPETEAELRRLENRLEALRAQYRRERATDRDQARLTAEEVAYIRQRIEVTKSRLDQLAFNSPAGGRLVIPRQRDLENGWVSRGKPIGHVVGAEKMIVLGALPQAEMELVSQRLSAVSVRFSTDTRHSYPAAVARLNPQATDLLPSELLASAGGGPFSLRQNAPGEKGLRSIKSVFVFEVTFKGPAHPMFGERAYVMFDHGTAPLSVQIGRSLRQLFLREFEV